MIDMLTEENRKLRDELTVFNRKVSRLQKFEYEIQKVHEAYESLVKSSQKREKLEAIMKKKLKEELMKLQATNKQLQGKTAGLRSYVRYGDPLNRRGRFPTRSSCIGLMHVIYLHF